MRQQPIRYRGLVAGSLLLTLLSACASMPSGAPSTSLPLPTSATPLEDYDWHYDVNADEVQLAYGLANSDDIPFGFSCRPGSGKVMLNSVSTNRETKTITVATADLMNTYRARQEEAVMFDGYLLEAETTTNDAVLASFANHGWMSILNDGAWVGLAPQSGTKVKTAEFIAACR